jgi:hypothetical protein
VTATIPERVARGAALLDKTLADWDERIDLDQLNLASECNCILGQEFTGHPRVDPYDSWDRTPFAIGMNELFANEEKRDLAAIGHGFDSRIGDGAETEYAALTAEWRRVILARRAGSR